MTSSQGRIARAVTREIEAGLQSEDPDDFELASDKLETYSPRVRVGLRLARILGTVMLSARNSWFRERAAIAMSAVATYPCVRYLLDALKADDARVRSHATEGLARIRAATAIPALRRALRDCDDEVRHSAVHALAATPGGLTRTALRGALRDSSEHVRLAGVWAVRPLARAHVLPDGVARSMLTALARADSSDLVRVTSTIELLDANAVGSDPVMLCAFLGSQHPFVRQRARGWLVRHVRPDLAPRVLEHLATRRGDTLPTSEARQVVRAFRRAACERW